MEALKSELEDSLDTTAAAQDLRGKREQEVTELKRAMDDEARGHETAVHELRHKYTQQIDETNEQLDQTKKVNGWFQSYRWIKVGPQIQATFHSFVHGFMHTVRAYVLPAISFVNFDVMRMHYYKLDLDYKPGEVWHDWLY